MKKYEKLERILKLLRAQKNKKSLEKNSDKLFDVFDKALHDIQK